MEWLDKQIELAKAQNGIVDVPVGERVASTLTQSQKEQYP